jgi:hypothetical protein
MAFSRLGRKKVTRKSANIILIFRDIGYDRRIEKRRCGMKVRAIGALVIGIGLAASSVMAETVFDQASNWISTWSCPICKMPKGEKAVSEKPMMTEETPKWTTDALGNKVPAQTMREGVLR